MNNDIVARLRTLTDALLLGDFQGLAATTALAADEIERLRESNKAAWVFNEELEKKNAELEKEREEADFNNEYFKTNHK